MQSPVPFPGRVLGHVHQFDLPPPNQEGRREDLEPLLLAARNGCRDSMGELLETCRAELLDLAGATLGRHLRAKADPDDLVQDALFEAQRDFVHFRGMTGADLRAWLRSILRHRLADFARHFATADKRQVSREVSYHPKAEPNHPDGLAGPWPPADESLIRHEELTELRRRLDDLPPHYRQVILWHGAEELSFVEIGLRLDRKPDAVRMMYGRALRTLRVAVGNAHPAV